MAVLPLIVLTATLGGLLVGYVLLPDTKPGSATSVWVAALIGGWLVVGIALTVRIIRRKTAQIAHQVNSVTDALMEVADRDLKAINEALEEPNPNLILVSPQNPGVSGPQETRDLSTAYQHFHSTLNDVAHRQMEVLQGGVSTLITDLARRNADLIDRQLALLDELESSERDPQVLGTYYSLDHLAARIRRNAENIVVMAGDPPPRVWAKSMEMSEVVRSALSEVEGYQTIEVVSVDTAQLAGGAVSDVAHLLAELLENAAGNSPRDEHVELRAAIDVDGYEISIRDRGPGMSNEQIRELNDVLANPPALGRVLDAKMGIYVVAHLAARHGISVALAPEIPGLMARVTIPRSLIERSVSIRPRHARPPRREPKGGPVIDLTDDAAGGGGEAPSSLPERHQETQLEPDKRAVSPTESPVALKAALADFDKGRLEANEGVEKARSPYRSLREEGDGDE